MNVIGILSLRRFIKGYHKIRKERVIGSYTILVEFGKSVGMEVGSMILLYKNKMIILLRIVITIGVSCC